MHLDDLDNETLVLLLNLGNNVVNEIYEKMVPKCLDSNPSQSHNTSHYVVSQKATPKCDK
jgi:hypothetical protein